MGARFYIQQRSERGWRWRTVTAADSRLAANGLAEELRRTLRASPYSPPAPVRVVSESELVHELSVSDASAMRRDATARA